MIRRVVALVCALWWAAACAPTVQVEPLAPLPTLAQLPSPTPSQFTLDNAERVARYFLEAWRAGDLPTMHSLTTFASQEATPLDAFSALYDESQAIMALDTLDYTITSQLRDGVLMIFNYDVTFHTRLLGSFSDNNRSLRLVYDEGRAEWRVAWSPADIFAAMGGGGRLRLEPRVPSRANIYDRDGGILADQNGRVVAISLVKREIVDYEACVAGLAAALDRSPLEIIEVLNARGMDQLSEMGFTEPATYLEQGAQLEADCGARFRDQPVRRYPDGTLAPHILGYVGYPEPNEIAAVEALGFSRDSILGRSGIESTWDSTLRGTPGGRLLIVAPGGDQVVVAEQPSRPSESLWLTLDSDLQRFVNERLAQVYTSGAAGDFSRGAAAVVLDIDSGEILALASYPSFDNNAFNAFPVIGRAAADAQVATVQADPTRPQLNRATQGSYAAGSIYKVITAIAAADSGVYALDQRYTCIGSWNRDIFRRDWLPRGHGTLTLAGGIINSCNPYFYETGYQLDQADPFLLPNYSRRLGLGAGTGMRDLPEAQGLIIDPDWTAQRGRAWTYSDAVNMAIGQGEVNVSVLQMARLYAAISNGGTLYRPQLVMQAGILGETPGYVMEVDAQTDTEIAPEVLDMVQRAMCDVTSTFGGTAEHIFRHSRLQQIGICGKTGTAQDPPNAIPHAWFASYAPRNNPEIVVVAMVENSGDGSAVAAPVVRDILEYYFYGEDLP